MEQAEIHLIFTERLEQCGIKYVATGSVAAMIYGYPRFTADLDLVVELQPKDIDTLIETFPMEEFYCPPEEVLRIESKRRRRGHFNIIHHETGYKADIYIYGDDPLHHWALANATRIEMDAHRGLWVAPPEYVIVRKLEYYSEGGSDKHIQDIKGMLEVSSELIDIAKIDQLATQRHLQPEWEKLKPM